MVPVLLADTTTCVTPYKYRVLVLHAGQRSDPRCTTASLHLRYFPPSELTDKVFGPPDQGGYGVSKHTTSSPGPPDSTPLQLVWPGPERPGHGQQASSLALLRLVEVMRGRPGIGLTCHWIEGQPRRPRMAELEHSGQVER